MSYNPFSLAGKTILVTGASSGIGRACAAEASKLGATVIACGRNRERLNKTMALLDSGNHSIFEGDLQEQDTIEHPGIARLVELCPAIDQQGPFVVHPDTITIG